MGIEREYKGPEDLLNFVESQKQKEERHKKEEGEHIRQFIDMQIYIVKLAYESFSKSNSTVSLDDYMLNEWQPKYSRKFRELFREERDAEENEHLDIWKEMEDEGFKKALIDKIIKKLYSNEHDEEEFKLAA